MQKLRIRINSFTVAVAKVLEMLNKINRIRQFQKVKDIFASLEIV